MIMCDECGIRPANIHLTTIVNGEKKDFNLCAECMQRKKELHVDFSEIAGQISKMLQNKAENAAGEKESEAVPDISCAVCGTSYAQWHKSGRVGCAQCYEAFRLPLGEWMEKKLGASRHIGRASGGMGCAVSLKMKLDGLKRKQKKAIEAEEYEQAAALRDEIRALAAEMEATRHE